MERLKRVKVMCRNFKNLKLASPTLSKKEVVALEKAKKKSLFETRKKAKVDKSLEKKEAFNMDDVTP